MSYILISKKLLIQFRILNCLPNLKRTVYLVLLLSWIKAFLNGRSQSVMLNGYQSDLISVISGVPQGSVLGPTLFLLYINDVSNIFQNLSVTCKLYADDIKLYSCYTTNCQSVHDLSEAIERLTAWSHTWQLSLAANKCFLFYG
jgi:ribonuclease P/MRP protein subunit RPP40